jgi:uroporphyrinogen decarboxylase
MLEAVGLVRAELDDDRAVVGFAGGPFTVAGYLVEGKPSRDFVRTKACMYREPETWHALMDKLADTFAAYVSATAAAGADVVQLFYSARVLAAADVPTIHFGTGTTHLLRDMKDAGGDVIGLDWRVPIDRCWDSLGSGRGVQGNLDPAVLLGPWERVEASAVGVLDAVAGRRGHIFNLGHGVLPSTDPADLGRLVELVRERTSVEVTA